MVGQPPQLVAITQRERLTNATSEKETFHIELDLSQTDITYQVGDCLAVYPHNHPNLVDLILSHFPQEQVTQQWRDFLTKEANLILPPKKLTEQFGKVTYLTDLLPLPISLEDFCGALRKLTPRFYSIASSMRHVGKKAHLTVTVNRNPEGYPIELGTCSDYLCHRAPLHEPVIAITHQPAHQFGLPLDSFGKPIIMIGPGTGVAPFRGFMQERVQQSASSKNWLFFGEQTRAGHFYYQRDWENYAAEGKLELDVAFSRDTTQKIYVQHKMLEKSRQLWQWIDQEKAYLFVCGDAQKMAKDVEKTLIEIAQTEGNLSEEGAKSYIKNLRTEKRYLRDVY